MKTHSIQTQAATTAFAASAILAATSALACPDFTQPAGSGTVELAVGFLPDPYEIPVIVGGGFPLGACFNQGWPGEVSGNPDVSIFWSGDGAALTFFVDTAVDSVILINAPDGQYYFNDDFETGDLRSGITFPSSASGRYDIWVGSYDGSGLGASATIQVSEF